MTQVDAVFMDALDKWVQAAPPGETRSMTLTCMSTGVWCIRLYEHNGKGTAGRDTLVAEAEADSFAMAYMNLVGTFMQQALEARNAS